MMVAAERKLIGDNFVILRGQDASEKRIGIYTRGGCHLHSVFACAPMIHPRLEGSCCIINEGNAARCQSDLELQTLQDIPAEWVQPVVERFRLGADYFQPRLFEETFTVQANDQMEQFPKTVVMIHIGPDSTGRPLYRHRKHGFLVDPGETWLNRLDSVLGNMPALSWFRETFESVGQVSVEHFVENYSKMIPLLRAKTGAEVMVFNHLTIRPGDATHTFEPIHWAPPMRWQEFNIALFELSRKLDFSIVNMDRILKLAGTGTQMDMAHFLPHQHLFVAKEAFRIMNELGVFDT
jgi:hypothetical protein